MWPIIWCVCEQALDIRQRDITNRSSVHHGAHRDRYSLLSTSHECQVESKQTQQRKSRDREPSLCPSCCEAMVQKEQVASLQSSRWQRWSKRQEMHDCVLDLSTVAGVNLLSSPFQFISIVLTYVHSPQPQSKCDRSLTRPRFIRSVALKSNICQPSWCSLEPLPL